MRPAPVSTPVPPAPVKPTAASAEGPLELIACSPLGGSGYDDIRSAAIVADGSILLAGNGMFDSVGGKRATILASGGAPGPWSLKLKGDPLDKVPADASGFIVRLESDGRTVRSLARFAPGSAIISGLKVNRSGQVWILGRAQPGCELPAPVAGDGEDQGSGVRCFVASLDAATTAITRSIPVAKASAFDVAEDGGVAVVGTWGFRYDAAGRELWKRKLPAYGESRPQAVAFAGGRVLAGGYGMTHTGKEPYKDPYLHAIDASGEIAWTNWNPDPKNQKDRKFGGTGLMADTTVDDLVVDGGSVYTVLSTDGGNSVATKDPRDETNELTPTVFGSKKAGIKETWQNGPGYGMKGAIQTCVVLRADAASGALQRGTWLCAWMPFDGPRKRANSLFVHAVAAERGLVFVSGASASYPPYKLPWIPPGDLENSGRYGGGGFLSVFDEDFQLLQSGAFFGSIGSLQSVAARDNLVVVGGSTSDKAKNDEANPVWGINALQPWSGDRDGWFAVFRRR